jgi:hypothetical protein
MIHRFRWGLTWIINEIYFLLIRSAHEGLVAMEFSDKCILELENLVVSFFGVTFGGLAIFFKFHSQILSYFGYLVDLRQ